MYNKKISKKVIKDAPIKDLNKVIESLSNGAVLIKTEGYKTEYAVKHPEGGYYTITESIYNKLKS